MTGRILGSDLFLLMPRVNGGRRFVSPVPVTATVTPPLSFVSTVTVGTLPLGPPSFMPPSPELSSVVLPFAAISTGGGGERHSLAEHGRLLAPQLLVVSPDSPPPLSSSGDGGVGESLGLSTVMTQVTSHLTGRLSNSLIFHSRLLSSFSCSFVSTFTLFLLLLLTVFRNWKGNIFFLVKNHTSVYNSARGQIFTQNMKT